MRVQIIGAIAIAFTTGGCAGQFASDTTWFSSPANSLVAVDTANAPPAEDESTNVESGQWNVDIGTVASGPEHRFRERQYASTDFDATVAAATPPRVEIAQGDAAAPADDLAALAQKTNNPISDAWMLITQNDMTLIGGDSIDGDYIGDTEMVNVTKFQPVLSVPVADGTWNVVVRPVLQMSSVPLNSRAGNLFGVSPNGVVADPALASSAAKPFGRTNGLGDTVLLTLLGPNTGDGWIFAGGISQIFPTASDDVL